MASNDPSLDSQASKPASESPAGAPANSAPLAPEQAGVNISGGNVTVGGDVVGRDKVNVNTLVRLGQLQVFNIDIRLLPVVVLLVVLLLGLGWYVFRPKGPSSMTGEFNVAVAAFNVLDENGNPLNSEYGARVATLLSTRLQDSFNEAGLENIHAQIWSPGDTGTVPGTDSSEREKAVQQLADRINANIVIHGVLQKSGDGFELKPEFYVNYKGFADATEITGEHELGSPLHIGSSLAPNSALEIENPALSARATALSLITIGLAYYSIDKDDKALDYFEKAIATPGWLDRAGKEVGYILAGDASLRMASKDKTSAPLVDAGKAFDSALAIDKNFARALAGKATVSYLLALGDPNAGFDTVDRAGLDRAADEFQQALDQTNAPASANISAKVHFGVGQIDFVKGILEQDDSLLDKAKQEFQLVIDDYKGGNSSIAELAGHSYARIARIALLKKDQNSAIEALKEASKLVSRYWQAAYTASLGDVYLMTNQPDLAKSSYQVALGIAEAQGDAESANAYQKKLDAVGSQQSE